jgi:putative phosphoesterase
LQPPPGLFWRGTGGEPAIVTLVTTLGVISDTHGQLRAEALALLGSVDRILHAGDVDEHWVLERLRSLGPVTAVRGNMDRGAWARALPETATITVQGFRLHLLHDVSRLDIDPKADGVAAVVYGHTHRPHNELRDGILFFNPGSAGPARYGSPVSVGRLHLGPDGVRGEIVVLGREP